MMSPSHQRLTFGVAVWLSLLFLLWLRFHQPPNTVDDAYTTFRYARNLANGLGFVYNPGERVLGTTTPAYALLLALASRLSGYADFPRLAVMVNALLNAIAFALLVRLTTRFTGWRWAGLAAGVLLALEGRLLDFSTGGMESSFYLTAILGTWALAVEGQSRWAALLAGLAVLIRPDGVTLVAALLGWLGLEAWHRAGVLTPHPYPISVNVAALRSRRWLTALPWAEVGLIALVVLPWLIFATLYFGQPIPQSVLAKSELYRIPPLTALRAFIVQLRTVFPFTVPPLQDQQSLARQLAQIILPGAGVLLGLWAAAQRRPRAGAIGLYSLFFIAFYSAGNPFWIGWYEIPIIFFYEAFILTAALWLARFIARRQTFYALRFTRSIVTLLTFILLALPFLSRLNVVPWEKPLRPAWVLNAAFNKRREFDYQLIAQMLAPAAQNNRLVAIPEIGAFGYRYGSPTAPGRLFDTSGLISPKTLDYFPIPADIPFEIYSVPRPLMLELKFDAFVSFDHFIQATIPLDDPEFLELYRPTIGLTSHAAFGIQRLMTYRRSDLPIEVTLPAQATQVNARFGPDDLTLRGYQITATRDPNNQFVDVILFWQGADAGIDRDLLVRARLLDAEGNVVYEILNQPGETLFPTQSWPPGFWLVDRYPLKRPMPDSATYTLAITVFASDADDSLSALAADGAALPANTLIIPVGDIHNYEVTP